MGRPLIDYRDQELRQALETHSEHVVFSYNGILTEMERRSQRLHRRLAIATSATGVLVAAAALTVSAIALLRTP